MIKIIIKILTSGELIELLDKNKNGKIEWNEITSAPMSVWGEIIMKYIPLLMYLL